MLNDVASTSGTRPDEVEVYSSAQSAAAPTREETWRKSRKPIPVSCVFTDYVRSLSDGGQPSAESFEDILDALRRALVFEMKRRGLWTSPPSFLGVYGAGSWSAEALEELLLDCYEFTFVRRLAGLSNQLLVRPRIDGLIFLNIRNFLHVRQKRHDPLGFRIFEILHAAVESLIREGRLYLISGDPKIRNDSILAFAPWHRPEDAELAGLTSWATTTNDLLLPDLVSAWRREEVIAALAERLRRLPEESGAEVIRFYDLIEPLKNDARSRWRAIAFHEAGETVSVPGEDGEIAEIVRLVRPDPGFEERRNFEQLANCVASKVETYSGREKTRTYLHRLWLYLRDWAASPQTGETTHSDKALSEHLDIPRAQVSKLRAELGSMIAACGGGQRLASAPVLSTGPSGSDPSHARAYVALNARRAALLRATAETAQQIDDVQPPQPAAVAGILFVSPATRALPVEWAVLDQKDGRLLIAPCDEEPWALRGDLDLGVSRRLRCAHATWVDSEILESALATGELTETDLERARQRQTDLPELAPGVTTDDQVDPETAAWAAQLKAAGSALGAPVSRGAAGSEDLEDATVANFPARPAQNAPAALRTPLSSARRSKRPAGSRYRRMRPVALLAAGLAICAVGLSTRVVQLERSLRTPMLALEPSVVTFDGVPGRSVTRGDGMHARTSTQGGLLVIVDFNLVEPQPDRVRVRVKAPSGSSILDSDPFEKPLRGMVHLQWPIAPADGTTLELWSVRPDGEETLLESCTMPDC